MTRAESYVSAVAERPLLGATIGDPVTIVDAFPLTVTGKVQKFVMREQSVRELGLEPTS